MDYTAIVSYPLRQAHGHIWKRKAAFSENTLQVWFSANRDPTMFTRLVFIFAVTRINKISKMQVVFLQPSLPFHPKYIPTNRTRDYVFVACMDANNVVWLQKEDATFYNGVPFPGNRRNLSPFLPSPPFPFEIAFQ